MRRFSLLMLLTGLLGCAQILDIEERKSTDDGPVDGMDSALCQMYCDEAEKTCTRERKAALFETPKACLGTCQAYAVGDPRNPTGNTLACRLAKLVKAKDQGEFAQTCAPAGPAGSSADPTDTAGSCSTTCEGYCALRASVCGDSAQDCLSRCKALPDVGAVDAHESYISNSDTLQCRLAHVGAAASAKRDGLLEDMRNHCGHSGIKPTTQCNVGDTATHPYSCNDYCKLVTNACTGNSAVYATEAQCLAVCTKGELPVGKAADLAANSLLCRRENGYLALLGNVQSCTDAGPAPGRCGNDKCDSFCLLASKGCGDMFKMKYGADPEAGQQECRTQCRSDNPNKIPGSGAGEPYAVNSPAADRGPSMACRIQKIARVLGDNNPSFCSAVFGGPPCDPSGT